VHIVTLSFDDGFERSSVQTAEIFERHGLVAELNVLASNDVVTEEKWHGRWPKGDFGLWNELRRLSPFSQARPAGSVTTSTGSTTKAGDRSGATCSTACSNTSSRVMSALSRSRPRST